jgi:hypothetical protein
MKRNIQQSDLISLIAFLEEAKYAKREEKNIQRNERKKRGKRKIKEWKIRINERGKNM